MVMYLIHFVHKYKRGLYIILFYIIINESIWIYIMKYPYEIHITVKHTPHFKNICDALNIKAITIELNTSHHLDDMTSVKFFGTDVEALSEVDRIKYLLQANGCVVIREKIETVPWHHLAPQTNDCVGHKNYFECHLNIHTNDRLILKMIMPPNTHISKNTTKKDTLMVTYRNYTNRHKFESELADIKNKLLMHKYIIDKEIIEFVLYDSNVQHDNNWLNI